MLLLFFLLFTPTSVRSDWASNIEAATNSDDLIEKMILFNEVSKILVTEKFNRVEFLVPFPTYDSMMKPDLEKMIQQLSLMWETTSLFCPLNFSAIAIPIPIPIPKVNTWALNTNTNTNTIKILTLNTNTNT